MRVFSSSSCALAEPVAGLALAVRLTLSTARSPARREQRHDVGERAHVGRLFLHPDDLGGSGCWSSAACSSASGQG
jgi:hypothetical protein